MPSRGFAGELKHAGHVVAEGELLAGIAASDAQLAVERDIRERDLEHVRPDLAEVQARHALLEDESRPEAVERRRNRGQRTARAFASTDEWLAPDPLCPYEPQSRQ